MHMETSKLQNATCLSPQTQNEMIDVIGTHIMQAKIVKEIKDAQIYTTMVDEITSHAQCGIDPTVHPICWQESRHQGGTAGDLCQSHYAKTK